MHEDLAGFLKPIFEESLKEDVKNFLIFQISSVECRGGGSMFYL